MEEKTQPLFDFGDAIKHLEQGKRISRKKWGDRTYLLLYKGQEDIARHFGYGFGEVIGEFYFTDTIAIKKPDETMLLGWRPEVSDIFAKDWFTL